MDAASSTRERLAAWWALPALIVAGLTAVGIAVRVVVVQDSLFADELSTYWIVSTNGLGGVISTVHTNAEITPPLYFVLAWLTTRLDVTAELLRAPSFVAGIAAIPLTYVLGLRTVGRRAALVATAITALAPFAIFYSTEARGYELMVVLVRAPALPSIPITPPSSPWGPSSCGSSGLIPKLAGRPFSPTLRRLRRSLPGSPG